MSSKQSIRARLGAMLSVPFALALQCSSAHASPLFDLAGDTSSTGALQARTLPGGSAAAYFNPALLIDSPGGVTLGFMVQNQRIGIYLDGRPGTQFAVPEGIANAGHADASRFDNYPIPTNLLQFGRMKTDRLEAFAARPRQAAGSGHDTLTYETFGLVIKPLDDLVAFGMHMVIPNGQFTTMRSFFNDEREQYFSNSLHPELFADRMTALSMGLGLGISLSERFSLGVGATFALKAGVDAPAYVVDTSNLSKVLIDMNASVNIGVTPHFGASYRIDDHVRLTATAHAPQKVELDTSFTFLLANAIEQSSGMTLILAYVPWKFGLGASVDLVATPTTTLSLAGNLLYATWSTYVDRHGFEPTPMYAWKNTISPTLGLRYRMNALSTALDLSYVPTPVPDQTGRSNYVDNDRITGALGADYGFELSGGTLKVGAQVQAHRLQPRYQQKLPTPTQPDGANIAPELVKDELPDDAQLGGDPLATAAGLQTNNPGWPGYSSGGWVLGANVYVSLGF